MTSDSGGIARLGALLGALDPHGPPPVPREVAELLWLAANLPAGALVRTHTSPDEGDTGDTPPSPAGQEAAPADPSETAADEGDPATEGRLYLSDGEGPGQERTRFHPASLIRVTGAPALPRRRPLARSLRPLKRRVPSTTHLVLDEEATADRIAEESRWMPVLVPAQDRWLDLALVIDVHGDGAALWQPLGRELRGMLEELGAFRGIRTYWLRRRPDGTPGLAASPRQAPRSAATASDPTGRTLTLLLTDGVDPGWGTGAPRAMLRQWARSGPAAVLQTLPEQLWGQTALAPEPGRFRSTEPGGSSSRLRFSPYTLGSRALQPGEVPVPVLSIDPEWLAPWATAVAGTSEFDGAAVRLSADEAGATHTLTSPPSGRPVTYEEFLAQAQPGVFRLAAYLSAAPLNLAVMRLVQSAMLPHSPPSDLAEIVFSGLLHKLPANNTGGDPLQQAYEFAPGVRERLLSTLRRDEAAQVIANVSAYVERQVPGATARFTAAVADPDGSLLLPAGARHWAEVQNLVRRRRRRRTPMHDTQSPDLVFERRLGLERELDVERGPAVHRTPEPVTAHVAPAPADDRSTEPGRSIPRRFLITIGVSRSLAGLPELPQVPRDLALVREAFEALGYTAVLPELADNPTESAVLHNIAGWARSGRLRPSDVVVVYFAGHATFTPDGPARLTAFDSDPSTGQPGGISIPRLHRTLSGRMSGLMLILDTDPSPTSPIPVDPEDPRLWVVSSRLDAQERRNSTFARALTAELSRMNVGSTAPEDFWDFTSRLRSEMAQNRATSGHSISASGPIESSAFRAFFRDSGRPRSTGFAPLPADMIPWAAQSNVLEAILDWLLYQPADARPRIVTGPPGSGKTTLLRLLERHLTRRNRRDADAGDRQQHAKIRTVLLNSIPGTADDVARDLVLRLGFGRYSKKSWTGQVASCPDTVLVLLDRLHEAAPSQRLSIVDEVIDPLRELPGVRFVIADDTMSHENDLGTDVEFLHLPDDYGRAPGEPYSTDDAPPRPRRTAVSRSLYIAAGREPDFILSYARTDNRDAFVERFYDDLVQELRRIGARLEAQPSFRDVEGLGHGSDWARELGAAVGHCRAFVPLYSPAYLNSEYCGKEWTAFRERVDGYREETEIDVPALVPVLWAPIQGQLPEEIARFQYNDPALGEEYTTRGLSHILRTDPTGPAYRRVVEKVASQVQFANRFQMPSRPNLDLGEVRGLFPTAGRLRPAASSASHVQVFVAAGVADALPEGRHRPEYYGPSPWDWTPYQPPKHPSAVVRAQKVILAEGYISNIEVVDADLSNRLDQALTNNQMSILLIDPWSARIPAYRDVLAEFDTQMRPTTGVLVLCDDSDDEAGDNAVWKDLSRVFRRNSRRWNDPHDPLFQVQVGADEFDDQLARMLAVISNRLAESSDQQNPVRWTR